MTVKTGTAWAGLFVTLDATGAKATPTSGPAGVLYIDGVADAATVTISGSNPYKWSVTLPALTAGQRVDMYITATISTIATSGVVASEQADTTLVSEVKAETAAILSDTGTDGVLISTGTGSKQLDITSGVVKANLAQILGTVLTETAGLIAAGFKKFFNVATPTGTVNSLPDAVPGASGGLPTTNGSKISQTADLTPGQSIAVSGGTVTTLTNLPPVSTNWLTADGVKDDAVTKIQNGLSKPGTAQTISSNSDISAIKLKTDNLPSDPADQSAVEAAISAIPAGISAEDVMTAIVEGAITLRDSLKLHNAFVAGKVSGGGTEAISFRDLADTLDRILMTVDTSGNRTDVTKDLSDD